MSESSIVEADPFAPAPPDEVAERDALAQAIGLSQSFTLLFACCNQAGHRDRLMADVSAQLPELRVQMVPLRDPVRNLLVELRTRLESPPPDAIFLYGIEGWLPFGPEAEEHPFVRNLNAARNHFPREIPCPLVFWLPQHTLATLARAAPDFCSVRSGLYSFCAPPEVRERIVGSLTSRDTTGMAGLPYEEKLERAIALAAMLAEYEALSPELRDPQAESRLLNSQATLQQILGNFKESEPLFLRALAIRETLLGPDHPDTATSLDNLASLYSSQGRYAEAEPLHRRALAMREAALGPVHPGTATSLNNLAMLYEALGRYAEAEPLYSRALAIDEAASGRDHPDTATSLNNLASLYYTQGRYAEAEPLFRRALAIHEAAPGRDHPDMATSLNNLAWLYASQGRYAEAEPLCRRALTIDEVVLGRDHPHIAQVLEYYASLLRKLGRTDEEIELATRLGRPAKPMRDATPSYSMNDHPE